MAFGTFLIHRNTLCRGYGLHNRESVYQIPIDRAIPLTSKAEWTIDGGPRERAEVRDEKHGWGGKEVVEGVVQVKSEARPERKRFELSCRLRVCKSPQPGTVYNDKGRIGQCTRVSYTRTRCSVKRSHRLTGKRKATAWRACSEGGERGKVEVTAQHEILLFRAGSRVSAMEVGQNIVWRGWSRGLDTGRNA